jgi:MATE family multidrug resistance protein
MALWRIGVPTGVQFSLEVGAFALLAALIARMGTAEMAGHQIALQVIHFSFLPGLGLSEAASVLVGQAVGAGRLDLVLRVARSALAMTSVYTGLCTALLVAFAPTIAAGFSEGPVVQTVATRLLWIAAVFQVLDGANVVARGVLRGAGDVRVPAAIGVATSWLATPPLAWVLGMGLGWGAAGGWLGLTLEIGLASWLLWRRLLGGAWQAPALAARAAMVAAAGDAHGADAGSPTRPAAGGSAAATAPVVGPAIVAAQPEG